MSKKLTKIVWDFNETIGANYGGWFTYETSGGYEAILFGDAIIWESENHPIKKDMRTLLIKLFKKHINDLNQVYNLLKEDRGL